MIRAAASVIAAAVSALAAGCSEDTAYDDPAVAVCEWLAQRENVLPGQDYERRVSAKIAGSTVNIEFEVTALGTKPELHRRECRFALIDGGFRISEPPLPDLPASCDRDIEAAKRLIKDGIGERNALKTRLAECVRLVNQRIDILATRAARRDIPLVSTGLYPIDPAKTRLKID